MGTFIKSIAEGIHDGRFRTMLRDHCLQWRYNLTRYAINNVVAHLADSRDDYELFETLSDNEFRSLKVERFGINAVGSDLQKGLEFFSVTQPDLLKFLQILFLEQRTSRLDGDSLAIHQKYCRDFAVFLQLDVPPGQRQQIGVHRVLNKMFPLSLYEKQNLVDDSYRGESSVEKTNVELVSYELGVWHCKCGELRGQARRFDHVCQCGMSNGNGLLDESTPPCSGCHSYPSYVHCSRCGTRVTLDLVWHMRKGKLHPGELQLPVTATLLFKHPSGVQEELEIIIMDLPLMLGFRERNGRISFDLPDMFWFEATDENTSLQYGSSGQIVALANSLRYDRRTELLPILESILRRALNEGGRGRSLKARLLKTISEKKRNFKGRRQFTQGFIRRLCSDYNKLSNHFFRPADLLKFVHLPLECAVAASSDLNHKMVFVNRNLLKPGVLSPPFIATYTAVIRDSTLGSDILTPTPLGAPKARSLGDDGIVEVGTLVNPGEPLVGMESPKSLHDLTAEEKLLRAVFDETNLQVADSSLIFQGMIPGRVLAVHVNLAKGWNGVSIRDGHGKLIRRAPEIELAPDELARITISLSVAQPIEVGDILYADDESDGVICRIASGLALAKFLGCTAEPDLVVSPNHPWAPAKSSNSQSRYVRVGVRGHALLVQEAVSRSIGPYSFVNQKPLSWDANVNPAQRLEAEDFSWLLACEAQDVAFELFGPHCDCVEWRSQLFDESVRDVFHLNNMTSPNLSRGLLDSPSDTIKFLGLTLLATGLKVSCVLNQPLTLGFGLMTEQERLALSRGEVTNPETLNFQTFRPTPDGLFCAKIFGPIKDWECLCGKYRRVKHRGRICDKCGVEVTESYARRERFGHISLASPVVNPLYLKLVCEYLARRYHLDEDDLKDVIYFKKRLGLDAKNVSKEPVITDDNDLSELNHKTNNEGVNYYDGGEAVLKLLDGLYERATVNEMFGDWQNIIMQSLLILPPDRRPLVPIGGGRFATSDLNDFYRRVINRNNRLKKLIELRAPKPIMDAEKLVLQEAIDYLFDNLHRDTPLVGVNNRPLKSLADHIVSFSTGGSSLLEDMLRRPVDYSARSRLVVGDTVDIDTAIFPEHLVWDLLLPLIIQHLEKTGSPTIRDAREEVTARTHRAYQALINACSQTVILVAPNLSPWRLLALRPQFSSQMALIIHRQLMDLLGWENLGKQVRLFGVLSLEATSQAVEKLRPSVLCDYARQFPMRRGLQHERESSMFFIEKDKVLSEFARRALWRESYILGLYDKLIMCLRN
jgi:hypothetical protein